MKCKDFNKMMIFYLDGDIESDSKIEFQKHIQDCNNCKNDLNALKSMYSNIDLEKAEYSHNHFFAAKVISRMDVKYQPQTKSGLIQRYISLSGLAAAAVVIGIIIGTLFTNTTNIFESTSSQNWEQLADEYLPEYDTNPYQYINENNP